MGEQLVEYRGRNLQFAAAITSKLRIVLSDITRALW